MKERIAGPLVLLLSAFVVLAIWIYLSTGLSPRPTYVSVPASISAASPTPQAFATISADEAAVTEGLWMYPGAKIEGHCQEGRIGACAYSIDISAPFDVVIRSYEEKLQANNWTLLPEESEREPLRAVLRYVWNNPEGGVPVRRFLSLRFNDDNADDNATPAGLSDITNNVTNIFARIERWPDANRLPVFSGMQQLTTELVKDPGYGVQELITTYLTTAKPEDIENVYSEKLLEEGWWRDTDATRSGISFVYSRELVKIAHSIIRITTESLPDGQTKVRVSTFGDGVNW